VQLRRRLQEDAARFESRVRPLNEPRRILALGLPDERRIDVDVVMHEHVAHASSSSALTSICMLTPHLPNAQGLCFPTTAVVRELGRGALGSRERLRQCRCGRHRWQERSRRCAPSAAALRAEKCLYWRGCIGDASRAIAQLATQSLAHSQHRATDV
jgi:hypothetical protein